ncbi:AAA family ATPase [uncultured Thiodictyon sp.]|uniref:AAA family ATPase n=1 Tax=uncultured Thiodictyon sp. TaxID=1846217 RepID=UPI0026003435|nr:AAA family ATPase [uncultured Thiodictyon sp.]
MTLEPAERWDDEVPGTRWFRADLHLHTLDDPYVALPPGIEGERDDPAVLRAFAERFLDAAVEQGIEVLGLTPHAACIDHGVSAAWTIVETWRNERQASTGRAYRDLVYAVYPGFEPNFADGNKGIHLIFLFDPTVGKRRYLDAFNGIMGAHAAYEGPRLNLVQKRPADAFKELDAPKAVGKRNYIVVAPHPLRENGLLSRPDHYIADLAGGRIHAAELRRDMTLDEDLAESPKLRHAFERTRIALYHTSDAIKLADPGAAPAERALGYRFALIKLASPTLEALRQAFLGRDSRLRIPYIRDAAGQFVLDPNLPVSIPEGPDARPWIREIRVHGGASFLRDQTFRLSPDLTCIIGGSMTGKSTLLDGLRLVVGGERAMPDRATSVGRDALARARDGFLSGGTQVEMESPAGDLARPVAERFTPRFFSQGELKSLADDDDGIEHLLFHLVPGRGAALLAQRDALRDLDRRVADAVPWLTRLLGQVAEAEQEFQRTADAREAMKQFEQAGTAALPPAQQDAGRAKTFASDVRDQTERARETAEAIGALDVPMLNSPEIRALLSPPMPQDAADAASLLNMAKTRAGAVVAALATLGGIAAASETAANTRLAQLTAQVQAALVAAGRSASDLNQFDAYAKTAQHYDSFLAALQGKKQEFKEARDRFNADLTERDTLVTAHRAAITQVCGEVEARFAGRVLVAVDPEGRRGPLESWVLGLRNQGITRWWNSGGAQSATPTKLRTVIEAFTEPDPAAAQVQAKALGMPDAVATSFFEQIAPWARQLEVWALRSPDRYRIRWVEDGAPKDLKGLSGGRRVAVLLSLILESDDPTPLFVDQPEDELDNRFLNETIIPALHRLKGKRQVVFATHNANLVVNRDADQVIALEADAEHGRVDATGAIEDDAIRSAILRTLDGGDAAFRLRRKKYGY